MKTTELSQLTHLLDALQAQPDQLHFTLGFVAASEVSDAMLDVLIRIWSSYLVSKGILHEISRIRQELLT